MSEYRDKLDSILNQIIEKRKEIISLNEELQEHLRTKHSEEEVSSITIDIRV